MIDLTSEAPKNQTSEAPKNHTSEAPKNQTSEAPKIRHQTRQKNLRVARQLTTDGTAARIKDIQERQIIFMSEYF